MQKEERRAWLRERQTGIGGSDVGAILGVDKFRTPMDVYLSKIGDVDELDTAPIRRGRRLEGVARDMYTELTGRDVYPAEPMVRHSEYPMLFINPDGAVARRVEEGGRHADLGPHNEIGTLEVKSPGLRAFAEMRSNGMSQSYFLQVQHGLGIMEKPFGAFAAYSAERDEMLHFDLEPDWELIRKTQVILVEWWERHVVKRVPPEETAKFEIPADAQIPAGEVTRIVTPEFLAQAARYWDARELSEMAEALLEEEKARLIKAMGGALVVETDDYRFIHRHTKRGTTFDKKALEAAQPLDFAKIGQLVQDHFGGKIPESFVALLHEIRAAARMDMSQFDKLSAPSQPFKPYRLKKGTVNE